MTKKKNKKRGYVHNERERQTVKVPAANMDPNALTEIRRTVRALTVGGSLRLLLSRDATPSVAIATLALTGAQGLYAAWPCFVDGRLLICMCVETMNVVNVRASAAIRFGC